ncbi:Predicted acyltransferase [Duganella sp. CF402]|uniref:acyltransferase family protein n=1 Tax=unclassified Duganella TaxID=2636909 RepID=UPI0008AE3FAD|nr:MULTISPECIES: heparan-alpha-glucosaminide N-acetyltransferase domain-containing protein [unclassified Duganella]RZT08918.1 putative acyltransferase [Duganella sp. BK701]SEL76866.1 Predicted acyltransferase [Duganella sp. CF402]
MQNAQPAGAPAPTFAAARQPGRASANRVIAIDLLRGLAVIGMILVAYAGDWEHRFNVLNHASWRGFALADMIFPSFLFCAGAAMPYALLPRVQAQPARAVLAYLARRSAALFLLGLLLNLLPYFDFAHVRVMGILQRIGICYFAAGLLVLALSQRSATAFQLRPPRVIGAIAVLSFGYGGLLLAWDAPDCGRACFDSLHSLPALIDRAVIGVHHMWPYGLTDGAVTYEPEGLLSTLGALINMLVGLAAGLVLRAGTSRTTLLTLAAIGAALLLAGFALDPVLPLVKKIWTPSFALMSSGFSLLAVIALWPLRGGAPVLAFGANATLAFIGISLMDCVLQLPLRPAAPASYHDYFARLLGGILSDARAASATYSAALVILLGAALCLLYRKKIFLRL